LYYYKPDLNTVTELVQTISNTSIYNDHTKQAVDLMHSLAYESAGGSQMHNKDKFYQGLSCDSLLYN